MRKTLIKIQIVSDVVCPWCYVGKKRLERAMSNVSDRFNFEVKWSPYFLNPSLPEEGLNKMEHYKKKFGANAVPIITRMKATGEKEGIKFSYGGMIANTLNAHRLIDYADKFGKQNEVVNNLFRYYFEEEKNLGSIDTLTEAAKSAGLDDDKVREFLKGSEGKESIIAQAEKLRDDFGIDGVPFFIFNDKASFSGAQEPETFVAVFNKLQSE